MRLRIGLLAALALGGCQYPRDPDGTLDRVRGGEMRVGVTEQEPWVTLEGEQPDGVEPRLVEDFARRQGARVEWVQGSEEELVEALRRGRLDLVIGGLTSKNKLKKEVSPTRPYVTTKVRVGERPREAGTSVEGREVFVEEGDVAGALVEAEYDARARPVRTLAEVEGPVATDDFRMDDLGRRPVGDPLQTDKHVMFVRPGENAFQVELERYLQDREAGMHRLIAEEDQP